MTTIVCRDRVMVADSRETVEEEGGAYVRRCEKLFRVGRTIVGLAGDTTPGMIFLDHFRQHHGDLRLPPLEALVNSADAFTALVLTHSGVYEFDTGCRAVKIPGRFHAVGSGAKAALGALHAGSNAYQACSIACKLDPYSARPLTRMSL